MSAPSASSSPPSLAVRPDGPSAAVLSLSGDWTLASPHPGADRLLASPAPFGSATRVRVDAAALGRWDSTLLVFLRSLAARAAAATPPAALDLSSLPAGARTLLDLAAAPSPSGAPPPPAVPPSFLARVGLAAHASFLHLGESLRFADDLFRSFGRLLAGRARFRASDFRDLLHDCGPSALPILSLLAFLIGVILSFLGSVQLKLFGAELFVANAVAIGMTREMGGLITGILMAGRTAASFAARLGTMQVNEEIDALLTMGFSPMDFLVLPRTLALLLMLPLLAVYAMAMGILGGACVGVGLLGIAPAQYLHQTVVSLSLAGIRAGLVKVFAFAFVIAICGCRQGLRCGRSAEAVGTATTSAVVQSLVGLVVADSLISVLYVLF
jgi:phospholipid/cholesterol/gamma-HCH transport system permease protein